MYNNPSPPLGVGGGLAVTGVSSLQIIGLAIIAITLCVGGLLLLRSARLKARERSEGAA